MKREAQELGGLKAQFGEERTKWDEANKQNMREHESLRKQNLAPPSKPLTQFPFTSDPPVQGKMPAGGVIAHPDGEVRRQRPRQRCRRDHCE
jgi:hypothetical protein